MSTPAVAVVIPAYNEQARIRATVEAARAIPGVSVVVVVDDGSSDDTSAQAQEAGAVTVRHDHNRGKAAALTTGAATVARLDAQEEDRPPRHLLFLDADLQETAAEAAPLVVPIVEGTADMSIGLLPRTTPGGGWGFVVRLSSRGIERLTGWTPTQPVSGQRCFTRQVFDRLLPLAPGFGVEVGMTVDALRQGFCVVEVPVALAHRVTGTSMRDRIHRARQWRDVARALAVRTLRQSFDQRQPAGMPSTSSMNEQQG
jgi:glycosyltransferase involved in cell wall biosynthesis